MTKRMIGAAIVVMAMMAMGAASAHDDTSPESTSQRCDTWNRPGHNNAGPGGTSDPNKPGTHEHESSSDIDLVGGYDIHAQSGHYVVRGPAGYVEVVGGQSYKGPAPNGHNLKGQGGYVQGEIDLGNGAPDVDYHASVFAPNTDESPSNIAANPAGWAQGAYADACVSPANNKQNVETRTP